MRFSAKFAGALLGLAGMGLLMAPAAAQAAPAVGVDEVVDALGLASEAADYVLLVDTSGSMNTGGRYPEVRKQLRTLLGGLDSDDRVSLLTFDSTVVKRYRGELGTNPDAVLAHLPATATGDHTDIGAAIDGGLAQLESADTHRLAALILITDGVMDTVPNAKYAKVDSASWKKLKSRAANLKTGHELAAYAVSLITTTDAGLLKKVVPEATEVSADEVGSRFARVADDLVHLQAAKALKDELATPITVGLTGDLGAALANGTTVPVRLDVTSPYPHVPFVLSDLVLQPTEGLHLVVTGLPESISLEPGATATATAQVAVTGSAGSTSAVSLTAKVGSPWAKVLEQDLGLTFAPSIEGTAIVPPAPIKIPPTVLPIVGAAVAVLVAALLILLVVRVATTPPMDGVLTFTRSGRDVAEIVLRGRRAKLLVPAGAPELVGLTGLATGSRRGVRLDARFGSARARGLLSDAASLQLGDMTVTYVSGRRRILDKIGLPRTEADGN
ncbi:MAG TPA: vWA domain-containing protein [Propionicimonas sp.]|uniref:vWA domain-containing protein n=1 Tax=Propionicimonas sp. TaxID=1955623 RepID=UPI002F41FBF4